MIPKAEGDFKYQTKKTLQNFLMDYLSRGNFVTSEHMMENLQILNLL